MSGKGKKFASEFDRIDAVKSGDKILVWDSSDGIVKYATPSQVDAMFDRLVADIDTATNAAASATSRASEAASSATQSSTHASKAQNAQAGAESAAGDAEAAAADAHNALDLLADSGCSLDERVDALEKALIAVLSGSVLLPNVQAKKLGVWGENNLIVTGAGAPVLTPDRAGQFYIDVATRTLYYSTGNSAISDWKNA